MKTETMAREEGIQAVRKYLKANPFCMLTTVDATGQLHSRPMAVCDAADFDGDLWFFTRGHSHKVMEAGRVSAVNCAFADPKNQNYLSVSGDAELVRDQKEIESRWKPQYKAWFPKGTEEPDIALLRVRVMKAEYWDSPSSFISHIIGLAQTQILGRQPDVGENKVVHLQ